MFKWLRDFFKEEAEESEAPTTAMELSEMPTLMEFTDVNDFALGEEVFVIREKNSNVVDLGVVMGRRGTDCIVKIMEKIFEYIPSPFGGYNIPTGETTDILRIIPMDKLVHKETIPKKRGRPKKEGESNVMSA